MSFVPHRSKPFRTSAYRFHSCSPPEADRWGEWQGDFCGHCSVRWEARGCNCSHEQHLPAHQIQRGFPHCYFEWYCGSLEVMIFSLDSHNTVNFCISEKRVSCLSPELHSPDSQLHLLLLMAAFWQGCCGSPTIPPGQVSGMEKRHLFQWGCIQPVKLEFVGERVVKGTSTFHLSNSNAGNHVSPFL